MRNLKLKVAALLSMGSMMLHAQTEGSSFTQTGRGCATTFARVHQTTGINPATYGCNSNALDKK